MLDPRHPGPDYLLRWPRELLVHEAKALATHQARSQQGWSEQVLLLLEEAFVADQPSIDFQAGDFVLAPATMPSTGLEKAVSFSQVATEMHQSRQEQFLHQLIRSSVNLSEQPAPQPYYAARNRPNPDTSPSRDVTGAKNTWRVLVDELLHRGYLDRVAARPCVDHMTDVYPGQDADLDRVFTDRLGSERLWRSVPASWSDDDFFSMVEVIHDVVARPRRRRYHDFDDCGWHYSAFATYPAQVLYRWTVNRLLRRHGIDLQLAKSGEDAGRLVHRVLDPRQELITQAVAHVPDRNRNLVDHAIAQFRRRGATLEEKRSACTALAHVLEDRTPLITKLMNKKDESDLFNIANNFAIRHQNAKQRTDYAEEYLDWIFWSFLATVELTSQLITRQGSAASNV